MRYIKTYEYVRNLKYSNSLINDFINKIRVINKMSFVDEKIPISEFGFFRFNVNPKYSKEIINLIPRFIYKLSRYGLLLYTDYQEDSTEFNGRISEPKLKRAKPSKYVYHLTPEENVEYILENGLKTEFSDSDKWGEELSYPNSIFASLESDRFGVISGYDVLLKIETDNLPNKWWVDLNFYSPNDNLLLRDFIMTFDDIPSEYISIAEE